MASNWIKTNLAAAGSRTDDIWFLDDDTGWAVNSDGYVYVTRDGGASWQRQALFADSYLRCVSFSSAQNGWVGTLSGPHRLYRTTDGGETWNPAENLPDAPGRICGLCAVSDDVIFASGTNYPNEPAGVLRSRDGGESWDALDLGGQPTLLVDIFFESENTGWTVGGVDDVGHPERNPIRRDVIPGVFLTEDGGDTWRNLVEEFADLGVFPRGEWGWKIQKLGDATLIVCCENFLDGAVLRSDDRGATWRRLRINDQQRNSNLEAVGFVDAQTGWVGGWGDLFFAGGFTSATVDGGENWSNANMVGFRLNRFRILGDPVRVAYASGDTVYKYTDAPAPADALAEPERAERMQELTNTREVSFEIDVPDGALRLTVRIWERYGREVRLLVDETNPQSGPRTMTWDFTGEDGARLPPGGFILRTVVDNASSSRIVNRTL